MTHLTNGSMSYERRVKTGDFEHKHAAMTINYAFQDNDPEDGINELLARARTLVVQHVHQALRGNNEEFTKTGSDPVGSNGAPAMPVAVDPVPGPDPVVDPGVVVPDELNRGFIIPESFTKPDEELLPRTSLKEAMANFIPMAPNLKAAKRAVKKRKGSLHEHDSGPFEYIVEETPLIEDPTPAPSVGPQQSPNGVGSSAPVVDGGTVSEIVEDFTAEAPAATDMELGQALSRINAKLKDRPRIQALIGEFVQSGQSYTMIPAIRRGEFVSRLEALV